MLPLSSGVAVLSKDTNRLLYGYESVSTTHAKLFLCAPSMQRRDKRSQVCIGIPVEALDCADTQTKESNLGIGLSDVVCATTFLQKREGSNPRCTSALHRFCDCYWILVRLVGMDAKSIKRDGCPLIYPP